MGPDARATARAAAVLADLLRGNATCKQQVVTLLPLILQASTGLPEGQVLQSCDCLPGIHHHNSDTWLYLRVI